MSTPSRVESIFLAALAKKATADRADYLDHACDGDAELRRQVERLLEAHAQAADFMTRPAVERPGGDAIDCEPHPPGLPLDPDLTCDLNASCAVSTNGPSTSPAPDPDSTCDLNPSCAVSTNGPSTSPAPDLGSTCDLTPSRALSTGGPSTSPSPGPEATGEFDPYRTVAHESPFYRPRSRRAVGFV